MARSRAHTRHSPWKLDRLFAVILSGIWAMIRYRFMGGFDCDWLWIVNLLPPLRYVTFDTVPQFTIGFVAYHDTSISETHSCTPFPQIPLHRKGLY
jgi:hypothetical protein